MSDTPETDKWTGLRHDVRELACTSRRLERQRDALQSIIREALNALPVGYIPSHTPESLPARVAELLTASASAERQRDAYAETLRLIATANARTHHRAAFTDIIRERHPELAQEATETP